MFYFILLSPLGLTGSQGGKKGHEFLPPLMLVLELVTNAVERDFLKMNPLAFLSEIE